MTVRHYGADCLCGKRQYNKKSGKQAASRWRRSTGEQSMQAYKCPHNHHIWHIGHNRWGKGRLSREQRRHDLEQIIDREQETTP